MSKWIFPLVAIGLIASMVFTAVVHACSDLRSMQAIVQAPCDHGTSQDQPRGKTEKDNCDLVRFSMLSTKVSPAHPELLKVYSIPLDHALLASISLRDTLPLLWRSQGSPLLALGVLPRLSHVVLRI
jgi:hypothetical protein